LGRPVLIQALGGANRIYVLQSLLLLLVWTLQPGIAHHCRARTGEEARKHPLQKAATGRRLLVRVVLLDKVRLETLPGIRLRAALSLSAGLSGLLWELLLLGL
jgi:hypothetical protein